MQYPIPIFAAMLTNKEIARAFNELAGLMELHDQNSFKIKSYQNAYRFLRKVGDPLTEMAEDQIAAIPGVGKAIVAKILELVQKGEMATLEKWRAQTPEGIRQMLSIKGFGPKKIKVIWKTLGIETVGELLYACNENRLIEVKGFGKKTQAQLQEQLEYYLQHSDKFHLATLHPLAEDYLKKMQECYSDDRTAITGKIRRDYPIVEAVELVTTAANIDKFVDAYTWEDQAEEEGQWILTSEKQYKCIIYQSSSEEFGTKLFETSHEDDFIKKVTGESIPKVAEEEEIFSKAKLPYILPALREMETNDQMPSVAERALDGWSPDLVKAEEVRGVVHAHSTYSDGVNSIKEMAARAQQLGYEYLGLTDHSQTAFYADGLKVERLYEQWDEIDALNDANPDFRIFKGIESDILGNGGLDYEDDILMQFDFIIASVHSNLKMDIEKATQRLVTAVENPYTTILGHPTGRLLLARKGYPIDYKKIIDACSANGVAIEINANPLRLDLDWTWISYALEQDVMIAINPDAHSTGGIEDIKWGTLAARKGGLTAAECLCCMDAMEFEDFCRSRI